MAEEAKQDDDDLSIEEILSSIRDIISDEDEEAAEEAPAADAEEKEEETVESVESVSQPVEDSVREELISAATASASLEAMSKLVADEAARPDNSSTIEQITKDLLRPMLKDWLDANLPALIEKLVQKELRRLSLKSLDE